MGIDKIVEVLIEVGVDMMTDVTIMDVDTATSDFDSVIRVETDIGVDVLFDGMNLNGLADVMNVLEFALPAPRKESMPCCWAVFSLWTMDLLYCDRALHAWMPSNHV